MLKVLYFYIICCTSNIIIDYILSTNIIEGKMFFFLLYLYTCIIYAPVSTLIAFIANVTNINKIIFNNYIYGLLYSILPHIASVFCDYCRFENKTEIEDLSIYVYIGTFILMNLTIFVYGWYNKQHKLKNKQ